MQQAKTIDRALQLGYCMIDTAGDYGTQPGIGKALRNHADERDSLYVVTKVEETDDAYEAARNNVTELGLQYADLIPIHRPPEQGVGRELWEGLQRAKQEGLTKDIAATATECSTSAHRTGSFSRRTVR